MFGIGAQREDQMKLSSIVCASVVTLAAVAMSANIAFAGNTIKVPFEDGQKTYKEKMPTEQHTGQCNVNGAWVVCPQESLAKGGGDPLKGLNIARPKPKPKPP